MVLSYWTVNWSVNSIGKLPTANTAAAAASAAAGGASVKRRSADEEVKKTVEALVKPAAKDENVEKKESAAEQAHVRTKRNADQPIVNVETATEETGVAHCLLNPTQRYKPLELTEDSALAAIGRINSTMYILIFFQYSAWRTPVVAEEKMVITYSYEVVWLPSDVRWASRWDIYLSMSDVQIHWFSLVNSIVVVFFLAGVLLTIFLQPHKFANSALLCHCSIIVSAVQVYSGCIYFFEGLIAMIMIRTVRRDIANYNRVLAEPEDVLEETGWKLVHGDVFRPPQHPRLLASLLGSGIQLFWMILTTICMLRVIL